MDKVISLLMALSAHGVRYTLVGGIALNLHGIARNTLDIDLLVPEDADNIERLKSALESVFHDPCIQEITASDLDEYSVIRYGTPDEFYVDIILRLGEMFTFSDVESSQCKVGGVPVSVATPAALFRMKSGTLRPQDRADAVRLQEKFGLPVPRRPE